jgi:hypothetical protein
MKTKQIALSALSTAFATIFLTLGAYIELIDLPCTILASFFVMLPSCKGWHKYGFLTFLASAILSFIFYGFNIYSLVFPSFILLFGLYPFGKNFIESRVKNANTAKGIMLLWVVVAFYIILFYYIFLIGGSFGKLSEFIERFKWLLCVAYGVVAVVFYFVYDRFVNEFYKFAKIYIDKIIKK